MYSNCIQEVSARHNNISNDYRNHIFPNLQRLPQSCPQRRKYCCICCIVHNICRQMSIFAHAILHKDGRKKWGHKPPPTNALLMLYYRQNKNMYVVGSRKFLCSIQFCIYVYSTPSLKINIAFGGTTKKVHKSKYFSES